MRRGLLAIVLVAFVAWFFWKASALPGRPAHGDLVDADRPARGPGAAGAGQGQGPPARVRGRHRLRARGAVRGDRAAGRRFPTPPIDLTAEAPGGYRAQAHLDAGTATDAPVIVPIRPAAHVVAGGTLCLTNQGRHSVLFYGTTLGRNTSPSATRSTASRSTASSA